MHEAAVVRVGCLIDPGSATHIMTDVKTLTTLKSPKKAAKTAVARGVSAKYVKEM